MKKTIQLISIIIVSNILSNCSSINSDFRNLKILDIHPSKTYGNSSEILPSINTLASNDSFIVAVSGKTSEIFIFDNKLNFINKFGKRGRGPQEIVFPEFVSIDNANNIYIYDGGEFTISHFKTNGTHISEKKLISRIYPGNLCLTNNSFFYHSMDSFPIINTDLNGRLIKTFGSFYPHDNTSEKYFHNMKLQILPYENNIIAINCQHSEITFYDFNGELLNKLTLNDLESFFLELQELYSKTATAQQSEKFAIINIVDSSIDENNLYLLLSRTPHEPEKVIMNNIVVIDLKMQVIKNILRMPNEIYQSCIIKNRKCVAFNYDNSELQLFDLPKNIYE